MKKKALLVAIIILVLGAIMISLFSCYNKTNLIEKNFDIVLPQNSSLSEFSRSSNMNGMKIAAKIIISSDDYNDFISKVSEDYNKFSLAEYTDEAIDDIIPPDSDRPINIEKFDEDLSWWDLEINQISLLFYQESNNPRFGVRTPCIKRIYISEQSDQITLYLYYFH